MKIVFDHLFEEKKDVVITLFLPAEPLEEKKMEVHRDLTYCVLHVC